MSDEILVFGAGSWGSALAIQLAHNGHTVHLYVRKSSAYQQLSETRMNAKYLPGIAFPPSLKVTDDWPSVMSKCRYILIATPSIVFSETLNLIKKFAEKKTIISATKGFCHLSYQLLDQLADKILPDNAFSVITGPSFAKEVAKQLPTAVLVASKNREVAKTVQALFNSATFRCYTSGDVTGAEIGGAVKNVLAIACGISDGFGFGANASAALITRGLKEMIQLGLSLGARAETFSGLSGLGDLVLTCTDNQSRNRRFGVLLGQGKTKAQAIGEIRQVVEGIETARAIYRLSQKQAVEMPIVSTVYQVLYENCPLESAVNTLLTRDLKAEYV